MRRQEVLSPIFALALVVLSLVVLASYAMAEENPKQMVSIQGVIQNVTSKGLHLKTGSEIVFIRSAGRWTYTLRGETQTLSWGLISSGGYLKTGDIVMVTSSNDTKAKGVLKAVRIQDVTTGALLTEIKGRGEEKVPKEGSDLDKFLKSQDTKIDVTLAVVGGTSFIAGFGVRDAIGRRRQHHLQTSLKQAKEQD